MRVRTWVAMFLFAVVVPSLLPAFAVSPLSAAELSAVPPAAENAPATKDAPLASEALKQYVAKPDASYTWTQRREGTLGKGTYVELTLTSQTCAISSGSISCSSTNLRT